MSIQALNWVFAMHPARIDGLTRSVLVVLADHADEQNTCWPSIEKIQKRTSWSERAVRKALRKLEAMGLISSCLRYQTSSRYTLHVNIDLSLPGDEEVEGAHGAPSPKRHAASSESFQEITSSSSEDRQLSAEGASGAPLGDPVSEGAPRAGMRGHVVPFDGAPRAPEPPENHQRTTRGRRAGPRATPLPPDWQPGEAGEAYARRLGLDPGPLTQRFRKTFLASGRRHAAWAARWAQWCAEDAAGRESAAASPPCAAPATFRVERDAQGLTPSDRGFLATWQAKIAAGEPYEYVTQIFP